MLCTNCGQEIIEGAAFCTNCGTAVSVVEAAVFVLFLNPVDLEAKPFRLDALLTAKFIHHLHQLRLGHPLGHLTR